MCKYRITLLLLSGVLLLCGCDAGDEDDIRKGVAIKIMPLGDSRVAGKRPDHDSYRYELWKNLVADDWHFDFIGEHTDQSVYPEFMNRPFDQDHAGVGGYTSGNVLNTIENTIEESGTPDVVLLGIGGNDLLRQIAVPDAIANINGIIDVLQGSNEDVIIFLEQIAPARSDLMSLELYAILDQFNAAILETAQEQTEDSSRVIVVDMATEWKDSYMADPIHYNEEGAKEVADRYYEAMTENLDR